MLSCSKKYTVAFLSFVNTEIAQGSGNPSRKTRIYRYPTVNVIALDVLVTQGAMASTAIALKVFSQIILVSAIEAQTFF